MSAKLAEADVNKLHYPENKTVKKAVIARPHTQHIIPSRNSRANGKTKIFKANKTHKSHKVVSNDIRQEGGWGREESYK